MENSYCYFHLKQSIFRTVQKEGLERLYMNDLQFRQQVKVIVALAFIPGKDVFLAFNCIKEMPDLHSSLKNVLVYFEENYMGQPMRRKNARSLPRFSNKN